MPNAVDSVLRSEASRVKSAVIAAHTPSSRYLKDTENGESIFVHSNGLSTPIKENDLVSFETERGFKGLNAVRVKVVK